MHQVALQRRLDALVLRARALADLRDLVGLPPEQDITAAQWTALEAQLRSIARSLEQRLLRATAVSGPPKSAAAAQHLNERLGRMELELAAAYTFFDTYMDVLTQRLTPQLGRLLAGCDRLAWDALSRPHPQLAKLVMPIVFCDRGFAAAIIRQDVRLPGRSVNPLPLLQIPYSRLQEKYNLTSVLHEAGHQGLIKLGLLEPLRAALARAVATDAHDLPGRFALWASEIGPDFWGFCLSGPAQASSVRDILSLPPGDVFRLSNSDPHPPPYIRVLLSFEWCRQVWGKGRWDDWERDWLGMYPLEGAPADTAPILDAARRELPGIARALLSTRFSSLSGRRLVDLFDLTPLAPQNLARLAQPVRQGRLRLSGLPPCSQLAVFRTILDDGSLSLSALDSLMTEWLLRLGRLRPSVGGRMTTGIAVQEEVMHARRNQHARCLDHCRSAAPRGRAARERHQSAARQDS
jgi:hypothetical protein